MLEIHIIGSTNSGKSTIAKLISKALSLFNINNVIIDEMNYPANFETQKEDILFDAQCLSAIAKRHPLGKGIEIKMIQTQRDAYANTKLSDKE